MSRILNDVKGYVNIEIKGFSVERFINLAARKGIRIWDVQYTETGVSLNVSVKDFKRLGPCAKKTKCTMKILHKNGYPFFAYRYRKRKLLFGGVLFFIAALFLLSSFIWRIDVTGNERLSKEEILEYSESIGFKVGIMKFKADLKEIEKDIQNHFKDISWISIYSKGTGMTINLSEIIPKQEIYDTKTPSNLIAKKDGLVTAIATSAGTPLVKPGSIVKKGDMLVSGEITVKNDETGVVREFVNSTAVVYAKTFYEVTINVPFEYTEKEFSGQAVKSYSIKLINSNINLYSSRNPFINCDKISVVHQLKLGNDYPLPVQLIIDEFQEFRYITKVRTTDEAKLLAEQLLADEIAKYLDTSAQVIDKKTEYTQSENELMLKVIVTANERIDERITIS